tara:strand:+ start:134 stop:784 length:651 start_codon:yes stop_codon:yes gene_type:complete
MKNKLAENLLRFGIKNLKESELEKLQGLAEQSGKATVENISLDMGNMLAGNDMARIQGTSTIYTFPERTDGESVAGDVATYDQQSVLYAVGGGQYVVVGQLGILQGDNDSNWSISALAPKVFTFLTTPMAKGDSGTGNNVRPYPFKAPFSAANPALVIAKLAGQFKGRAGKINKSFPESDNGKQFIDKMVSVFKAAGLAQDVADMDAFYKSVTNYI